MNQHSLETDYSGCTELAFGRNVHLKKIRGRGAQLCSGTHLTARNMHVGYYKSLRHPALLSGHSTVFSECEVYVLNILTLLAGEGLSLLD